MKHRIGFWTALLAIAITITAARAAQGPGAAGGPEAMLAEADMLRVEKSFRQAAEIYDSILEIDNLPAELETRAKLWRADCQWRENRNRSKEQEARKTIQRLIEDLPTGSRWRAEAFESLGDLKNRRNPWDWNNNGDADWLRAMEYWKSAEDMDAARPRYIELNFKIARQLAKQGRVLSIPTDDAFEGIAILPPPPPENEPWKNDLASWCLRNVLRVTGSDAEKAEAYCLLGRIRVNMNYDDGQWRKDAEDYLKKALAIEAKNEWRDDALYWLGQLHNNQGRFVEAVEVYDAFLDEFPKGKSEHRDQVEHQRNYITSAQMNLYSDTACTSDSFIRLQVRYRNVSEINFTLEKLDPATLARAMSKDMRGRIDFNGLEISGEEIVSRGIEGVSDDGRHQWENAEEWLEPLQPGIYRMTLKGSGGDDLSQMLWIGSAAGAIKISDHEAEVFAADAASGKPIAGAKVWFIYRFNHGNSNRILTGETGAGGLAHFKLHDPDKDRNYYRVQSMAIVEKNGECAYVNAWGNYREPIGEQEGEPTLYVFTDRPAYRPDEPIHWKAILRYYTGKEYRLPVDKSVFVRILDTCGNEVYTGDQAIGEYGSVEGELTLDRTAALGMLNIELWRTKDGGRIGSTQLARLEEYKLPEYKVAVSPGRDQVKFGDAVPFTIQAEYYFGGPVADADVEIVVHRKAFWPSWSPLRPYPWLWANDDYGRGWPGHYWRRHESEEIVLTQNKKTDGEGRLNVEIGALDAEALKNAEAREIWGYQYRVEARVVDASRREVKTSGSVRVARTGFQAFLNSERYLYLPGDKVEINLKTLDPNDRPVGSEGMATIYKRKWNKEKLDEKGVKAPGYDDTELFKRAAATGAAAGEGELEFEMAETGTYLVRYETRDGFGNEIKGETMFFVASKDTSAVGYRSGGVEIVTDKDYYERGETAQVMLVVRRPGAAVWFGVEGDTSHSRQVVALDGAVKLVPVEITEDMEPNIYFTAMSLFDYAAFNDTKRIVVPPTRRFLDVKIVGEKAEYKPGEAAEVQIEVKDSDGKPVTTELSLGVADSSVWAIQSDVAADIREHFWNRQRGLQVRTQASAQQYSIVQWIEKEGAEREYEIKRREEVEEQKDKGAFGGGSNGRYFEGMDESNSVTLSGVRSAHLAMKSMDAPAAAEPLMEMDAKDDILSTISVGDFEGGGEMAPARVRSNFSSTALWLADVVTDADGRATAKLTFPDSLTAWRFVSRTADKQTRVGEARLEVKTNKPVMVRPQAPRFFVEGDVVTLSAIVNNNTDADQKVRVAIEAKGLDLAEIVAGVHAVPADAMTVSSDPVALSSPEAEIMVPAHGQRRVDWKATASTPGEAVITTSALSKVDSDAAEKKYPILEYGIEQFIAGGLKLGGPDKTVAGSMTLDIPKNIKDGSAALTVNIEPALALTMVNSLEYLINYPYGCVEQTISRFVPTVLTLKVLRQLGLKNEKIEKEAPAMVKAGLERLYDFQHADGGWAWWKKGDSDPFMTAYVLQGLAQAREADVDVKDDVLRRGCGFLQKELVEYQRKGREDMLAFTLYALSCLPGEGGKGQFAPRAHEVLWERRENLNPYTRALFALACHQTSRDKRAAILVRNMDNGLIEDKDNGTAHWGRAGVHWRWSEGGVEATAFSLRALLAIDPQNPNVDRAMKWLTLNRRGARWKNTRDTAIVVRALADYITVRGEDKPEWNASIAVNGQHVTTLEVTPENVFEFDGRVEIPAEFLKPGEANTVEIEREGTGVLYAAAWLTYFTREEKIKAAGNEVFVERRYFLTREVPTLEGKYKTTREEIKPGDVLTSGDRVEVQLDVEAKNHYEYLVIEDMKAAGMEPAEVKSGYEWNAVSAHREMRDEKTAFFISRLPEGEYTFTYELRAEIPGVFQALPTQMHAMYVPEIRANSENAVIGIEDKKEE